MTPVLTGSEDFSLRGNAVELAVVLPMKALVERRARGEEPGPAQPTQVELLAVDRGGATELTAAAHQVDQRGQELGEPVDDRVQSRREPASGGGRRVLAQSLPQCGGRSSR